MLNIDIAANKRPAERLLFVNENLPNLKKYLGSYNINELNYKKKNTLNLVNKYVDDLKELK